MIHIIGPPLLRLPGESDILCLYCDYLKMGGRQSRCRSCWAHEYPRVRIASDLLIGLTEPKKPMAP